MEQIVWVEFVVDNTWNVVHRAMVHQYRLPHRVLDSSHHVAVVPQPLQQHTDCVAVACKDCKEHTDCIVVELYIDWLRRVLLVVVVVAAVAAVAELLARTWGLLVAMHPWDVAAAAAAAAVLAYCCMDFLLLLLDDDAAAAAAAAAVENMGKVLNHQMVDFEVVVAPFATMIPFLSIYTKVSFFFLCWLWWWSTSTQWSRMMMRSETPLVERQE